MTNARSWPIHVVRTSGGRYLEDFRDHNLVGIEFGVDEDLMGVTSWDEILQAYLRWNPDDGPGGPIERRVDPVRSAGVKAACLWRFQTKVQEGDVVISPDGHDFLVGVIDGDYFFRQRTDPRHCRPVRWRGHLAKAQLSADAQQALTSWLACFTLGPGGMGYEDLAAAVSGVLNSATVVPLPTSSPADQGIESRVERLELIVGSLLAQAQEAGRVAATLAMEMAAS